MTRKMTPMTAPSDQPVAGPRPDADPPDENGVQPYVAARTVMPEFTWSTVVVGCVLGIIFGASSLYLVLKVGLTVSASIPVAVLSITLFRGFSHLFGIRRATILENNIVQTTGSAGESIAFGVGVTIPALLLLGYDMSIVRVMTVGLLGGLLGILMMIPLRRAFIVKQHAVLPYPEGTACAEVLKVGEQGGATAKIVFAGFGLAFLHKACVEIFHLWKLTVNQNLFTSAGKGIKGGVIGGELTPELLGVGYVVGPRVGCIMLAGGILAYLVLVPLIMMFGAGFNEVFAPAAEKLIRDMTPNDIRNNYVLYIGAGAVAAGGIISMFQALPLIFGSLRGAWSAVGRNHVDRNRSSAQSAGTQSTAERPRTDQDLPLKVVVFGSLALVLALSASPQLGLGFGLFGIIASLLIVAFGFLFVTVSSRLTGTIGSSSNPISGMTVATLLLTCLIFVSVGHTGKMATLSALTVAAVVCIASSNGGTISQDLKTGYLVGATPRLQQWAILIGAFTSALVMGVTLILLNDAGTVYTKKEENLPKVEMPPAAIEAHNKLAGDPTIKKERAGGQYADDPAEYNVWHVGEAEVPGVPSAKYLVDDTGKIRYRADPAINGTIETRDDGQKVANKFDAPKTRLMYLIINGILNQKLPWELVIFGALLAVVLELSGVPSLPFAVGVYLPIQISTPIFIGGAIRWLVDRRRALSKKGTGAVDSESSPGVLLSSGYIAGGAIAGVTAAFMTFAGDEFNKTLAIGKHLVPTWADVNGPSLVAFAVLVVVLVLVGLGKFLRAEEPGVEARARNL
jgi:putative OPT family oligopeptide transporter